jgi:hypothetical protein
LKYSYLGTFHINYIPQFFSQNSHLWSYILSSHLCLRLQSVTACHSNHICDSTVYMLTVSYNVAILLFGEEVTC